MYFPGRLTVIVLTGVMAATCGAVAAAERYRCDTEAIRNCRPSGCSELAVRGSITLQLPAWSYKLCRASDCTAGRLEAWSGTSKPEDKGFVGFSQSGTANGFTGSIDFDSGEFVLIDGPHYWFGRCKAE